MSDDAPATGKPSQRWSETPWFWLLLFSGMALLALVAVNPKYRQRQGRLIRQFEARQQHSPSASRKPGTTGRQGGLGGATVEAPADRSWVVPRDETSAEKASQNNAVRRIRRRSRLAPLALLVAILFAVGVSASWWQHRRRSA